MRRLIQHFLGAGLLAGLLSAGPLSVSGTPSEAAEADLKPYTETIPGTQVSFDMVPIPAGTFLMGSTEEEIEKVLRTIKDEYDIADLRCSKVTSTELVAFAQTLIEVRGVKPQTVWPEGPKTR